MARGLLQPPVSFTSFVLAGGLDQVTPPLTLKPGVARDALNFEVSVTGGYSRVSGYERFDGRPAPSSATYAAMTLSSVTGLAVGNSINNSPGTATAVVIAISGTTVFYTKLVNSFAVADTVKVGVTTIGTVSSLGASVQPLLDATYRAAAADRYRSDILAVPGSGPIRGVANFAGTVYAWRDNVGGTAMALYRSSSSGWQLVNLGYELAFTTGSGVITEGQTVTDATSGATGVVARVVLESGAWTGTAAGRLILSNTTGTFAATHNLQVGGVTKAVAAGAATAITLAPAGRVQTVVADFGGAQTSKLYGSDNVNRGFEFDGTTYVPIRTGMTLDKPTNVAVHKQHLFFSFGSSLQFSALGLPYQWAPLLGAGELVVSGAITGLAVMPGDQSTGSLAVFTRDSMSVLYGSSSADFRLALFNTGLGAAMYTVQNLQQTLALDDRGVVSTQATQSFGNFDSDTLTLNVRNFIQARRGRETAGGLNREKGQYRVFYDDGYALFATFNNGRYMGAMPVFFPNAVTCWCEGASANELEAAYFGSTNGYVYRLDSGTSFDGQAIEYSLALNFNAVGNPRILKRFRKAALEISGSSYAQVEVGYSLAYADSVGKDQPSSSAYATALNQPYWDNMVWDSFIWDGRNLAPVEVEVVGSGENIAMQLRGSSALFEPFTVNTITVHYTPRRGLR